MCLAQFPDQHAGPFKGQAALTAATAHKNCGRATRVALVCSYHQGVTLWECDRGASRRNTVTSSGKIERLALGIRLRHVQRPD